MGSYRNTYFVCFFFLLDDILRTLFHVSKYISFSLFFLAVLGLRCCARAFSSCSEERGLLFDAVRRLLIAVASLVAEHGL